jgi:hypothetical protein
MGLLVDYFRRGDIPGSVCERLKLKREEEGDLYTCTPFTRSPFTCTLHTHCSPSSHTTVPLPYSLPPSSYCPLSHLHPLSYVLFLLYTLSLKKKNSKTRMRPEQVMSEQTNASCFKKQRETKKMIISFEIEREHTLYDYTHHQRL